MNKNLKIIAWDFDGVLNRNIVDGRFVWSDTIEEDLGISIENFQKGIFDETFFKVISGKIDLKQHVQNWLVSNGYQIGVDTLLEYWFSKDDLKDPVTNALVDKLNALGVQQVIATNNEHHRASYIEDEAGFRDRVSHVFSSGRIGHAKPDDAFFTHVSNTLDCDPNDLLLVDDSAANIRAAGALGWNTYHFTEETRLDLASYLGL